MWKKILVPLDGSSCAGEALRVCLDVAERWAADIIVCAITTDDEIVVGATPIDAREILEEACRFVRHRGVACISDVIHAEKPGQAIAQAAHTHGVDAIVIGTHGRSGFARAMMGSVAEDVLRRAACEVVLVRPKRDIAAQFKAGEEQVTASAGA